MIPSPNAVDHEPFCRARPGLDTPRMEGYVIDLTDAYGTVTGHVYSERCIECAAQSVDGRRHKGQ